ncbi:MAG: hypothetical protein QW469_00310 [Candidatus Aenigmatarchaeota archaeon]
MKKSEKIIQHRLLNNILLELTHPTIGNWSVYWDKKDKKVIWYDVWTSEIKELGRAFTLFDAIKITKNYLKKNGLTKNIKKDFLAIIKRSVK